MAWEWHERHRDKHGRFIERHQRESLHLRLSPARNDLIRNAATAARMELSAYVWMAIEAFWKMQLTEDGQEAGTSGGPPAGGPSGDGDMG